MFTLFSRYTTHLSSILQFCCCFRWWTTKRLFDFCLFSSFSECFAILLSCPRHPTRASRLLPYVRLGWVEPVNVNEWGLVCMVCMSFSLSMFLSVGLFSIHRVGVCVFESRTKEMEWKWKRRNETDEGRNWRWNIGGNKISKVELNSKMKHNFIRKFSFRKLFFFSV